MEIRPILSALMRSKVALVLIGLQIALTLAIVCNSLFIISQRVQMMGRESGINEADTFTIGSLGFGAAFDIKTSIQEDVALLRSLPGVADATPTNTTPMSNGGWSTGINLTREQKTSTAPSAMYFVDEHGLNAFGAKLAEGRFFTADEITFRERSSVDWPPVIVITRALANKLFPDQSALGKQVYLDTEGNPNTIIGVVERMQVPWIGWSAEDGPDAEFYSTFVPQNVAFGNFGRYLVRTEPGRRDEVMKAAEAAMLKSNHSRIVREPRTIERIRAEGYQGHRAMTIILIGVIVSLLAVTALGIVGMASFWVTQRTKQIGTRRALGATRGSILRYFMTENFVITSLGLALGVLLTYGLNYWLMANYAAQRLPLVYLAGGIVVLMLLGQAAVFGPATRASRVPPAVATRSV
ncbi:putative ABC transport system permease protein [Tahibacter aquaticus]|uniref:Putative ABC transport system permease protein n=1 Tax=Tahibacter aquaticus TaxID=520092 RepID=A0A4R6Z4U0_9GAMM|nr:FtsX-like permease family protein [Tahibacter aquaticus]TDR46671.1 putative ABC transport system permease protein [Tahibacter aquaticus]